MRFPFCVVPNADHTNEPEDRAMTASFAPDNTQAAMQIRLRGLAASWALYPRASRRGRGDRGTTFGRWPE
jgi:hypothetical protein